MSLIIAVVLSYLGKAWAWLKAHPTPAIALGVLVALLLSFGAGRYSNPGKVVTKTEVRTQVQYVDRVVTVEKKVAIAQVHRVVVTKYVKTPAGAVEKDTTVTTDTGTKVATNLNVDQHLQGNEAVSTKTETTTTRQPDWLVSAMAGAAFGNGAPAPFVGLQAQRRLAGPVWAGAFATVQTNVHGGTIGGSLGVSF